MMWNKSSVAARIDHTLLKPQATPAQIKTLCEEAAQYGFASVCINPCYVRYAASCLKDTQVKVCTVAGFPLGAAMTDVKACEAKYAADAGAEEIDMVLNVGMLKSGNYEYVHNDIAQVVSAVYGKAIVKVILETCLLTDTEKEIACKLAADARAHFVKTSTGFSTGGATASDVRLMRASCGGLRVKAAGGIRTYADAVAMLDAGADRIGASASLAIIDAAP